MIVILELTVPNDVESVYPWCLVEGKDFVKVRRLFQPMVSSKLFQLSKAATSKVVLTKPAAKSCAGTPASKKAKRSAKAKAQNQKPPKDDASVKDSTVLSDGRIRDALFAYDLINAISYTLERVPPERIDDAAVKHVLACGVVFALEGKIDAHVVDESLSPSEIRRWTVLRKLLKTTVAAKHQQEVRDDDPDKQEPGDELNVSGASDVGAALTGDLARIVDRLRATIAKHPTCADAIKSMLASNPLSSIDEQYGLGMHVNSAKMNVALHKLFRGDILSKMCEVAETSPGEDFELLMRELVDIVDFVLPSPWINIAVDINDLLACRAGDNALVAEEMHPREVLQDVAPDLAATIGDVWEHGKACENCLRLRNMYMLDLLGRSFAQLKTQCRNSQQNMFGKNNFFIYFEQGSEVVKRIIDHLTGYDCASDSKEQVCQMWATIFTRAQDISTPKHVRPKTESEWALAKGSLKESLSKTNANTLRTKLCKDFPDLVKADVVEAMSKEQVLNLYTTHEIERRRENEKTCFKAGMRRCSTLSFQKCRRHQWILI